MSLEYQIVKVDLRTLKPREIDGQPKNARFMKPEVFNRLVDNLKKDGTLTQFPLVYKGFIISGHHRVEAAIKAGIFEHDVQELSGDVDDDRLTAIQLAHNSIAGEDDPATLAEMYNRLPLEQKLYSGVTDDDLKVPDLKLSALSAGDIGYQEICVNFLPEDADVVLKFLERAAKSKRAMEVAAKYEDFNLFFDTVVKTKETANVFNNAIAIRIMAQLAAERLEQIEDSN